MNLDVTKCRESGEPFVQLLEAPVNLQQDVEATILYTVHYEEVQVGQPCPQCVECVYADRAWSNN